MRQAEQLDRVNKNFGQYNAVLGDEDWVLNIDPVVHLDPQTVGDYSFALRQIVSGERKVNPVRFDVDISNNCTNECVNCFSRKQRREVPGEMPYDELVHIFSDPKVQEVGLIRLTGGGDPTEHTRFPDIAEFFGNRFVLFLETHGDFLSRDAISEAVARFVDRPRISVDSGDNMSRLKTHNPLFPDRSGIDTSRNYDNLLRGMERTFNRARYLYKKGDRKHEMIPGATFVVKPQNYLSLPNFFRDMAGIGVRWTAVRMDIRKQIYDKNRDILPFVEETILQAQKKYEDRLLIQHPYRHANQQRLGTFPFVKCYTTGVRGNFWSDSTYHMCNLDRNIGLFGRERDYTEVGVVNRETSVFDLLAAKAEKLDEVAHKAPRECRMCVDVDPNEFLNMVASIILNNPNAFFSEARVVLGEKSEVGENEGGISQIRLSPVDYNKFLQERRVNLSRVDAGSD